LIHENKNNVAGFAKAKLMLQDCTKLKILLPDSGKKLTLLDSGRKNNVA
jgi:hypothetical protein